MRKNPTSVAHTEFVFQGISVNTLKVVPHLGRAIVKRKYCVCS